MGFLGEELGLVEHTPHKGTAVGSNPTSPTKIDRAYAGRGTIIISLARLLFEHRERVGIHDALKSYLLWVQSPLFASWGESVCRSFAR